MKNKLTRQKKYNDAIKDIGYVWWDWDKDLRHINIECGNQKEVTGKGYLLSIPVPPDVEIDVLLKEIVDPIINLIKNRRSR